MQQIQDDIFGQQKKKKKERESLPTYCMNMHPIENTYSTF